MCGQHDDTMIWINVGKIFTPAEPILTEIPVSLPNHMTIVFHSWHHLFEMFLRELDFLARNI